MLGYDGSARDFGRDRAAGWNPGGVSPGPGSSALAARSNPTRGGGGAPLSGYSTVNTAPRRWSGTSSSGSENERARIVFQITPPQPAGPPREGSALARFSDGDGPHSGTACIFAYKATAISPAYARPSIAY